MIALPTPIAAVTAAALQAGLTHWLVAPTTIECPRCHGPENMAVEESICTASQRGTEHCNHSMTHDICHWCGIEWGGDGAYRCPTCSPTASLDDVQPGIGRVPLVVNVGDRVTVPISDELPAMGQRIGAWTAYINPPDLRLIPQSSTVRRWLRLHPGGSLSGTVAAIPDTTTTKCGCPVNEAGDIHCHHCGERVNVQCWNCRSMRGDGPCPNPVPDTTTAALPIVAHSCFMQSDVAKVGECINVGSPGYHARRAVLWTHAGPTTITTELAFGQVFTPGMQAFRLTDVTVTPKEAA